MIDGFHKKVFYGPLKGIAKTAIHFQKDDDPDQAMKNEQLGRS